MKIFIHTIFILLLCCAVFSCNKDDESCCITGTVSEHEGDGISTYYEGMDYTINIDVDGDPDNDNHVKSISGTWQGVEFQYSIEVSDITPGMYYIYIILTDLRYPSNPWLAGYYGGVPRPWDQPASANADVKCGAVFDLEAWD